MGLFYAIQSKIFTFIGDIKVFGWAHPMWFGINAHGYKLKGTVYRKLQNIIQPGDIFLRRFDGYLSSYMIPGFWNHAGLYVEDEQVIHAISEGVIKEDILNFMRTDHMMVLRPLEANVTRALNRANSIVGQPYDFGFDFEDCHRFSCTELVAYCYPDLVKPKKQWSSFGKLVIVADDFRDSPKLEKIWDSTGK